MLEVAVDRMIYCPYTFDGITGVNERIRKPRQIVFEGKIWVITNYTKWNEELKPFYAVVTDKRITKHGIWIKMTVDGSEAEGDLLEVL